METGFICSFCGKMQKDVFALIAGPSVYICDECIELCVKIIAIQKEEVLPKRSRWGKWRKNK